MKTKLTILFIFTFLTGIFAQNDSTCNCTGFETIFNTINKDKNELMVCGYITNTFTKDSIELTSISVYDCTNNKYLIDYSYDEIMPFTVTNHKDSIVVYNHHLAPFGDSWQIKSLPFLETTVKFVNDTAIISNERVIFHYPELSEKQIASINSICKKLSSFKIDTKIMYPLEYETIYILFIGAYKNIGDSRIIFENLKNKFEFDGAAAETLGEIHYQTIMNNKN